MNTFPPRLIQDFHFFPAVVVITQTGWQTFGDFGFFCQLLVIIRSKISRNVVFVYKTNFDCEIIFISCLEFLILKFFWLPTVLPFFFIRLIVSTQTWRLQLKDVSMENYKKFMIQYRKLKTKNITKLIYFSVVEIFRYF